MDELIIIGLAAYAVELVKGWGLPKKYIALAVMGFTVLFCFAAAAVWGEGESWRQIAQQGIVLGAVTSGIYGLGKATKDSPPDNPFGREGT